MRKIQITIEIDEEELQRRLARARGAMETSQPLARMGEPDDIAAAVAWLAGAPMASRAMGLAEFLVVAAAVLLGSLLYAALHQVLRHQAGVREHGSVAASAGWRLDDRRNVDIVIPRVRADRRGSGPRRRRLQGLRHQARGTFRGGAADRPADRRDAARQRSST